MSDAPAAAEPALRPRGLWSNPDFVKLWSGQTISELGSRITREGIPLAAVLVLHAGTVQMGFLSALGGAAVLVFGLVAGVWVDRVNAQFRVELYNLFNRVNLAPPSGGLGGGFGITADTVGDYNGAPGIGPGEAFNVQLGLKITF